MGVMFTCRFKVLMVLRVYAVQAIGGSGLEIPNDYYIQDWLEGLAVKDRRSGAV